MIFTPTLFTFNCTVLFHTSSAEIEEFGWKSAKTIRKGKGEARILMPHFCFAIWIRTKECLQLNYFAISTRQFIVLSQANESQNADAQKRYE